MQKEITRTRMSEKEIAQFAARYAKEHDLKPGKELNERFQTIAVKRLAALERQAAKLVAKPKAKAKKGAAKKGKN